MIGFDRFVNLVYFWIVSRVHDPKERKKIDRILERAPRIVAGAAPEDYVPDWWQGDERAGQEGLAIARAFGFNVDLTNAGG